MIAHGECMPSKEDGRPIGNVRLLFERHREIAPQLVDNLAYERKTIIRHIELTFKYTIRYAKAWRAKQNMFEMRFGTYKASYDNLPRMLCKIVERNPGSHFDVKHFPEFDRRTKRSLANLFFILVHA